MCINVKVLSNLQVAKKGKKGGDDDEDGEKGKEKPCRFVVKGGQTFNAVVRFCLSKMEPALRTVLGLEKDASKVQIMVVVG